MHFDSVAVESIGYCLPNNVVTSEEIETQLTGVYERLRLPAGRLELMSGIRERRFWDPGILPSEMSIRSGNFALDAARFPRDKVGCLIHASVCRDHLEPATACRVHHALGLPPNCVIYDVSNACLGMLNGMLQIANMIELGQIEAGLVVGCESGRALVETTIEALHLDQTLTRKSIKSAIASLTIGSSSSAILLVHRRHSGPGTLLHSAATYTATKYHELCQSGRDEAAGEGMQPLMETDSEKLLTEGIAAASECYDQLCGELSDHRPITKTVCHQVGSAHRAALVDRLQLDPERDVVTYPWLGNTGSSALPVAAAMGCVNGHFEPGDQVGWLGIGSGINVVMIATDWQDVALSGVGEIGLQSS